MKEFYNRGKVGIGVTPNRKKSWRWLGWMSLCLMFLMGTTAFAQVSGYTFTQSSGTYTPISGGTVVAATNVATTLDSEVYSALPIGFTFDFNGVPYTTFGMNVNGWISMGSTAPVSNSTPISGTTNNVISAISGDLYGRQFITANTTSASAAITMTAGSLLGVSVGDAVTGTGIATGATVASISGSTVTLSANSTSTGTARNIRFHNGTVRYETIGTAPNRTLVVQFSKFSRYATAAPSDLMNFQIRLNETSNTISIVYDIPYVNASATRQVGLRGATNADFNVRTSTTSWSATTAGVSNSATVTISNTIFPASGQTFTWTIPTCFTPTLTATTSITGTTATINWTAPSTAPSNGYNYEVRTSGVAGSGATGLVASGAVAAGIVTKDITGLTSSSSYSVYVQSNCGSGDTSSWTIAGIFATSCGASSIPYTMPINAVSVPALPLCTSVQNVNADAKTWVSATSTTGITGKVMQYSYSSTAAADDWLYTNTLTLNAGTTYQLKFKYKDSGYVENLKVGIGSSAVNSAMTTTLFDVATGTSSAVVTKVLDFTVPSSGSYTIGFQCYSLADQNALYLGEISVELAPSCLVPTLTATTALAATTATINWTAPSTAPSNGYNYEIRTSGVAGSGATGLFVAGSTTAGVVTANITGLSASTSYSVYVQSNCGGSDTSTWTTAGTFTTACEAISTFEFVESFEAITSGVPLCWTVAGTTTTPANNFSSFATGQTGRGLRFNSYSNSNNLTGELITPTFDLSSLPTAILKFYFKNPTGGNFEVLISDDGGATYTSLETSLIGQTAWLKKTYDITEYISSNVKIKFLATSNFGDGDAYVYLDAINIDQAPVLPPNCATSHTPVDLATDVVRNSTLTWSAATGSPLSYDVYFGTSTSPALVTNVTGTSYTPATMAANTTYYWKVVPKNSNGDATGCLELSFTTGTGFNYCTSTATTTADDDIAQVTFGSLVNPAVAPSPLTNNSSANGLFTDFTALTTKDFLRATSYPIEVKQFNSGSYYVCWVKVFIDWNQDGDFDDVGEAYNTTGGVDGPASAPASGVVYSSNITVPLTATLGVTRMRIILDEFGSATTNPTGCGTFTYGETEDYFINILPAPSCIAPTALVSSSVATTTATLSWTASTSAPTNGYDIYYSTTNTAPLAGTVPTVINNPTATYNATGLSSSSTYYWWVRSDCGSETSTWASGGSFNTLTPPPTNENCAGAIALVCNAAAATYSSAGSTAVAPAGCALGSKGIWFSFMGTSGEITINSTATFDHKLSIQTGSCSELTWIACKDGSTGAETYTIANSVLNQTYYVYVAHYSGTSTTTGNITISIACAAVCPTGIWTGTTSSDWNIATNWSDGMVPEACTAVTVNVANPLVISTDVTVVSMNLGALANVTVNETLNVGNITVTEGGSMIVANNAAVLQTALATNSGKVTVKRNSAPLFRQDYTLWSSPVSGQNLRNFSPLTLFNRFSSYNTAAGTQGDYVQEIVTTEQMETKLFTNAKGYLIRMPNNWDLWNGENPASSYLGSFKGTLNNGAVTLPLSGANTRFNLVGNPYPSPISIATFFGANTEIVTNTLYFWRKKASANTLNTGSGYASYTELGIASTDPSIDGTTPLNIEVGQGFFVVANSASPGNVVFNNTMRNNGAATFYKGANSTTELHRMWLNLSNATSLVGQTLIGYKTGATQGFDTGIDAVYFNDSATALTSIMDNNEYIIQGRSLPFVDTDVVPLGFKTEVAGSYTISLANFDGLFAENQDIFLKDNATNTLHNLKVADYTFTTELGVFNERFEVTYNSTLSTSNPSFDANSILIGVKNQQIKINAGSIVMEKIELIDVAGRVIYTQKGVNATTATIENVMSSNQMLIVRISTAANGVVNQKIVY